MENLPYCTHRYALMVSYIGTRYLGSQRLIKRKALVGNCDTIQEAIESSLETVLPRDKCRLTAGSRTDKGVHSLMSCYTLPLMDFSIPTDKMKRLANAALLRDKHEIIINDVILAPSNFHPRRSCVSREYIYRVGVPKNERRQSQLPLKYKFLELFAAFPAAELYRLKPLPCFDVERAEEICDLLRGSHDFASFSQQTKEENDTTRHLDIQIVPANNLTFQNRDSCSYNIYHFHFNSRAFLHNQIRRMMGAIIAYASFDSVTLEGIQNLLDIPAPESWPSTLYIAEPWGLYLSRMNYDKSSFQGSLNTFEDKANELVDVDSVLGSGAMSDDFRCHHKNYQIKGEK